MGQIKICTDQNNKFFLSKNFKRSQKTIQRRHFPRTQNWELNFFSIYTPLLAEHKITEMF